MGSFINQSFEHEGGEGGREGVVRGPRGGKGGGCQKSTLLRTPYLIEWPKRGRDKKQSTCLMEYG